MNVCSLIWSRGGSTASQSAQGVGNTKPVRGSMAEQVSKYPRNILRQSGIIFLFIYCILLSKILYDLNIG